MMGSDHLVDLLLNTQRQTPERVCSGSCLHIYSEPYQSSADYGHVCGRTDNRGQFLLEGHFVQMELFRIASLKVSPNLFFSIQTNLSSPKRSDYSPIGNSMYDKQ